MDEEEKVLIEAKAKNLKKLKAKPTAANIADYEKASAALEAYYARQSKASGQADEDAPFENALAAHEHLKAQGWKVGRSKFYEDVKNKLVRQHPNGSFLRADVDRYAANNLEKPGGKASGTTERKESARADKIEIQAARERIELQKLKGELIDKERVASDLAARAQVFKADLINLAHTDAGILARTDDSKQVRDHLLNRFEEIMHRYTQESDFTAELAGS